MLRKKEKRKKRAADGRRKSQKVILINRLAGWAEFPRGGDKFIFS